MNAQSDRQVKDAVALLLKHFPDVDWTERRISFHSHHLSESWLNAGSLVAALEAKKELERLDRIERLARDLWREYHQLPLMLRSHLPGNDEERDVWRRIMRLSYDLTGKSPIGSSYAKHMPSKQGVIAIMRARVGDFFNIHHTQREAEISKKIHLAGHCYDLWYMLKQEPAPKAPAPGTPFYEFVSDVIVIANKKWSVERTLQKYHVFKDG